MNFDGFEVDAGAGVVALETEVSGFEPSAFSWVWVAGTLILPVDYLPSVDP